MVSYNECPGCGITTSDCFGNTDEEHELDCPYKVFKC